MASFLTERREAAWEVADGYGWEEELPGMEGVKDLFEDLLLVILEQTDTPFGFMSDCFQNVADDIEQTGESVRSISMRELTDKLHREQEWMNKVVKLQEERNAN